MWSPNNRPEDAMATTTRLTPESLKHELSRLEGKHEMSSMNFLEQFQAGKMGDSREMMHWAWLCSVALRLGLLTDSEAEADVGVTRRALG